MSQLPYQVGVLMVSFTQDRFKYQNWVDTGTTAWKPRSRRKPWSVKGKSPRNEGRGLLIQSGRLRRSIRIIITTADSVTIGTDVPYAAAHNEGLRIGFVQNVKAYIRMNKRRDGFSAQQGKAGKRTTRVKWVQSSSGISHVKAHKRRYSNFKIPQRQFMGPSKFLSMQISRFITAKINSVFR